MNIAINVAGNEWQQQQKEKNTQRLSLGHVTSIPLIMIAHKFSTENRKSFRRNAEEEKGHIRGS